MALKLALNLSISRGDSGIPSVALNLGALTPTGMGDYPYSGTVVSQVDKNSVARTDIDTTGSVFTAASTWVANCAARSPYTITTTSAVYVITATADTYHVGKVADWSGAGTGIGLIAAATLAGKTVKFRSGLSFSSSMDNNFATPLRRGMFGTVGTSWVGLVLESEDYANPMTFTDQITIQFRYVTFKGIRFTVPSNSGQTAVSLGGNVTNPVSDLRFLECKFIGTTQDPTADWSAGVTSWNRGNAINISDALNTNIEVSGCTFQYTGNFACQISAGDLPASAGNLVASGAIMRGNFVDAYYQVGLKVAACTNMTADNPVYVEDNVLTRPVGIATDTGNPHGDGILFSARNTLTNNWTVNVNRNMVVRGSARGQPAPIAFRDFYSGGSSAGGKYTGNVIGNVVSCGSTEGIYIQNADTMVVLNNTVVSHENTDGGFSATITVGGSSGELTTNGTHRIERNVSEALGYGGTPTLTSNIVMGSNGGTYSYAACFDGPTYFPSTKAEALVYLSRLASGPLDIGGSYDVGAVGSAAISFAAANPSLTVGTSNVS